MAREPRIWFGFFGSGCRFRLDVRLAVSLLIQCHVLICEAPTFRGPAQIQECIYVHMRTQQYLRTVLAQEEKSAWFKRLLPPETHKKLFKSDRILI